jgi:hypothetical protein
VLVAGAVVALILVGLGLGTVLASGDSTSDASNGDPELFCERAAGNDASFFDRVQRALDIDIIEMLPGSTIDPGLLAIGAEARAELVAAAPAVDDPDTSIDEDIRGDVDVVLTARSQAELTGAVDDVDAVRAAADQVDDYIEVHCA